MKNTSLKSNLAVRRRRERSGGIALALTLLMIFIFGIMAAGVMGITNTALRSAKKRTDMVEALNMADSGIDLGLAWLESLPGPPGDAQVRSMGTSFFGTDGTISAPFGLTGSTLTVRIYSNNTNFTTGQQHYVVESKAVMPSGATQIARAYLQQVSFGKYAYFMVNDQGFWDFNNHFEGPFHSNDSNSYKTTILWKSNNAADPIFTYNGPDAFSVSGDPTWWKDATNTVGAPSSTTDFNSIAIGGRATMTYGYMTDVNGNFVLDSSGKKIPNSPQIPMPTTDYAQEYAAVGQTVPSPANAAPAGLPTAVGATVMPRGGIFIHGDSAITLSVDASGNQVFTVKPAATVQVNPAGNIVSGVAPLGVSLTSAKLTQVITVNRSTGSTSVSTTATATSTGLVVGSASVTTTTGVPNGVIFSDGNITSLSGTVADNTLDGTGKISQRNQWTIATDTNTTTAVTISDSIKYQTARNLAVSQPNDTTFNTRAGTLGLISQTVSLKDGAPANVEIDAAVFTTNTFQAANSSNHPGGLTSGTMTCIGGITTNTAGVFAHTSSSGNITSGWNELYHYDQRMADYPPPWFPTTGAHYDVLSWQNVTTTIQ